MPRLIVVAVLAAALLFPLPALAQDPAVPAPQPLSEEPIGLFVIDARGVMAKFKQDASVAAGLGVDPAAMPSRGFGLVVGAHVYPLRKGRFALGLGADLLLRARGSNSLTNTTTEVEGPTVITSLSSFAPQLSLNFGQRDGWSYLSGGIGTSSFTSELEDAPASSDGASPLTINYGGGARWFAKKHLAFTFDVRFYGIKQQEAVGTRPAIPAMTVLVLSAGIGLR